MSATGFEETDLTYQVSESESMGDTKVRIKRWGGGVSAVVDQPYRWSRQKEYTDFLSRKANLQNEMPLFL